MMFITINTGCEFICFLAALIFLIKDKDTAWKLFIPYLLLTCLVEMTGVYMRKVAHVPNYNLYNAFLMFECGVTSYTFYNLYKPFKNTGKWLIAWYVFFIAMCTTELVMTHFKAFVSITAVVMSVVFVLASLYYYYLKLMDENFERLSFSAPFWWVSGALFFYFGSTTCNIFFDYLSSLKPINNQLSIRYYIFILLNITLYSFWSYAFLCRYLRRKSSS
ncbi:hypothetical protein ACFGVS_08820 [Mucilaginibacter sp. AW1-7]|jgi:hypothetical protein|uniref:hypothetical protein n=1 Tax=unclassified Mucilaginibacter TaxID=2617802 RepID=UPI0008BDBEED|nr:hypothetical protein [Mucilaginibacter sp. OK283]SEP32974.1 hypothetical protein SAMN05428947_11159 [Mucilaginibacter sp. OK283]